MIPDLVQILFEFEGSSGPAAETLAAELGVKSSALMSEITAWLPKARSADAVRTVMFLAALHTRLGRHQELADFAGAALAWRVSEGPDAAFQGACFAAQGSALLYLDQPRECYRMLSSAQDAFSQSKQDAWEEKVLADFVEYARRFGKSLEVLAPFMLRLEACRDNGDKKGEAAAMLALGRLEETNGHLPEMRRWLDASLALFRELGNKQGIQDCLDRLADRALREGDYPRAEKHTQEFLKLAHERVDRSGLVWSELRMAELEIFTGQLKQAVERLNKCLALISPQRERWNWAYFTNKLGEALRIQGRLEEAAKHSKNALEAFSGLGDAWGKAWTTDYLGYVLWRQGQREEGAALLESAARQHEGQLGQASLPSCLTRLAEVLLIDKGPAAAWPELKKAMTFCLESVYASSHSECLAVSAACFQAEGRALSGELALLLGGYPGSTYACKDTLKRLAVKPGTRLIMLADRPGRHVDLNVAMKLALSVATGH